MFNNNDIKESIRFIKNEHHGTMFIINDNGELSVQCNKPRMASVYTVLFTDFENETETYEALDVIYTFMIECGLLNMACK